MKKLFAYLWKKVKMFIKFMFNWRFALSFGIAWMITNGWCYIALALGLWFNIKWLSAIAGSYAAILYMPFTLEKLITIPLAILICKLIFPKHKQVQEQLNGLLEEEKSKLKRRKKNAKDDKPNRKDKERNAQ